MEFSPSAFIRSSDSLAAFKSSLSYIVVNACGVNSASILLEAADCF